MGHHMGPALLVCSLSDLGKTLMASEPLFPPCLRGGHTDPACLVGSCEDQVGEGLKGVTRASQGRSPATQ